MSAWTRPTIGSRSAYTVLAFAGFVAGAVVAGVLSTALELELFARLVVICVPPVACLAAIRIARRRAGYERIVFYECLVSCLLATTLASVVIRAPVARMLDIVTIGIGVFLVLGRIGCFRVACCHGRPARHGVRYGREHVRVGFPRIWEGRTMLPLQLVESAISLALTVAAIGVVFGTPGDASALYVAGYGIARFALEELRGDRDRRYVLGLSEAQRMAMLTAALAAVLHVRWWTIGAASVTIIAASLVFSMRRRPQRRLLRAGHFLELCALLDETPVMGSATTSEDLTITRYQLPDGRLDCVMSRDTGLTPAVARRLAHMMHFAPELVPGRTPGLVHVVIPARVNS
jgi:prolipoprotein diacylglyceryltransferase